MLMLQQRLGIRAGIRALLLHHLLGDVDGVLRLRSRQAQTALRKVGPRVDDSVGGFDDLQIMPDHPGSSPGQAGAALSDQGTQHFPQFPAKPARALRDIDPSGGRSVPARRAADRPGRASCKARPRYPRGGVQACSHAVPDRR